jgi:hypothetical protein
MNYFTPEIFIICILIHIYYHNLHYISRISLVNIIYIGQLIRTAFQKEMGECVLDSSGLGQGQVAGPFEHGSDPSSSVKF